MRFYKGAKLVDKNGVEKWEKVEDEEWGWWVCLDSYFLVTKEVVRQEWKPAMSKYVDVVEKVDERHPESEKYLFKKDEKGNDIKNEFNRWSFRWTDEQVYNYYKELYNFVT